MRVKMLTGGAQLAGALRKRGEIFDLDDDLARAYVKTGDLEPVAQTPERAIVKPGRNTMRRNAQG